VIIQALNQYYDILTQNKEYSIPRYGYSIAKVSYVLRISNDGKLNHIIDIRLKDKKTKPKEVMVPKQDARANAIIPYFLCENAKYIFGVESIPSKDREKNLNDPLKIIKILEDNGGDIIVITKRSQDCFLAFKSLHHSILDSIDRIEGKYFLSFLDTWKPEEFLLNPKISEYKDEILKSGLFIFEINGLFLQDLPELRKVWENYVSNDGEGNHTCAQCLVTGLIEPISRTHNVIKGVANAQMAGARLVSFNGESFTSYMKEQSFNAPVGITAEFKYTTILNYLLSNPKNKLRIADSTVVFWAETSDRMCEDLAMSLFNPPIEEEENEIVSLELNEQRVKDEKTIRMIHDILKKVRNSQPLDPKVIGVDPETSFYILGLSPNNARLSVRFWYCDTFGHFVNQIAQHHLDLDIIRSVFDPPYLSINRLLKETIPKSVENGEASPILGGLILNAILNGTPYPVQMYYAILNRVKVERSINFARAGFIKAYLLRLSRSGVISLQENLITMSLNEESLNVPYRLGRLFAVLEKVQSETNKEMGSTITSKYFSSASATPAVVFPVLLKLAQHHIAKSDWGFKTNQAIEQILSGVDVFPAYLTLEEQGMFMLGFYHQKQAFFIKKEDKKEE
jgi:CRISPR-associated protein Csd1